MAQSYNFPDPEKDAYNRQLDALSKKGTASVSGGAGQIVNLMRQLQGGLNYGALDNEAIKGINRAQGDVESTYARQLQGFHQNTGGGLLDRMGKQYESLRARGLQGAIPALGDMGTDRNYNQTMSRLRDSWFSNLLGHQTNFLKQRTGVANQASTRLSNILQQLSGLSAGLVQSNTPSGSFLPKPPAPLRMNYSTNY